MSKPQIYFLALILSLSACQGGGKKDAYSNQNQALKHQKDHRGQSPYAGQQNRNLKAFLLQVIKQLKKGSCMAFYGMAKPG
jgi:hypothetical protein